MARQLGMVIGAALCLTAATEAQNSQISWWVFSGGGGTGTGAYVRVRSAAGQPFSGRARMAGTQIVSGFFADTLLSGPVTGITEEPYAGEPYALQQNYPNPFNPSTTVNYSLARGGPVDLSLYNLLGERVAVLVNEVREAGVHTLRLDASRLPTGTYFLRLRAGSFSQVRRIVLVK